MNKKIFFLLLVISLISLFFNVYKKDTSSPCFNADEAAFGYNAYSILKTGKDEYGTFLPIRLKSFGDYKMPLYSYLSIPFISLLGLNENSTRLLNTVIAFLLPWSVYLLTKELFKKDSVALLASLFASVSLGLHIVGRQAHEAYLTIFLITLATYFFIRTLRTKKLMDGVFFCFFIFLSLFSYQSSRIFAAFFFVYSLINAFIHKPLKKFVVLFAVILFLSILPDVIYKPDRVKNLLFFNNAGFPLKINELRQEGGSRLIYNKLTVGIRSFAHEYLTYFSPQFLISRGDENPRFGLTDISPVSLGVYVFFFIGCYYVWKCKEKNRWYLFLLLLVSPLAAAFSWASASITRSLFLLIPFLIISAYGVIQFVSSFNKLTYRYIIIGAIIIIELFFSGVSWDLYLNHYPQRALVTRAWQCGYKELVDYVKNNYEAYDSFYITKKHGQPYIFFLFYQQYNPMSYQQQAQLSKPDEYGFGQVKQFDKYIFSSSPPVNEKRISIVGYPDDFTEGTVPSQIISSKGEEIFWIRESKRRTLQ